MSLVGELLQKKNWRIWLKGLLSAGISGGANVWTAIQLSNRDENKGKVIVTFICDTGERYVSTEMYE